MKANCEEELKKCHSALEKLSCNILNINEFKLPKEESKRTLIKIIKNSKTNTKYPRTIDKIKKQPL